MESWAWFFLLQNDFVIIQVSCKIFCHEGSKFRKDMKKTLYFLLRAFEFFVVFYFAKKGDVYSYTILQFFHQTSYVKRQKKVISPRFDV